jgi:FAD/FMN-containing dehydrogenase/Fe-S oxidoreductase
MTQQRGRDEVRAARNVMLPQVAALAGDAFVRELAGAIEGEVRFDAHNRMLYSTDASLYQVEPLGVVIPASVEDGVRAVGVCARYGVAMLPRGGGTSLAGQCTNRAVVIDWSNRCRGWRELNVARKSVYAEPGVTVDDLNDAITASGLFFAPDPATARHASIGGCIGNNAAGSRSVKYGRTSESVHAIDACLADGRRVRLERGAGRVRGGDALARELAIGVSRIVREHATLIRERFPKTVRRNAGYGLDMILQQLDAGVADEDVDLTPLLCGSEGTLAITLGAVLKLHERPKSKALAVLGFSDLDEAIAMVEPILATGPSAVEMLDDIIIDLAKANTEYRKYVELMPQPADGRALKAVLYVEYFGGSRAEVEERVGALAKVMEAQSLPLRRGGPPAVHWDAGAMMNAWKLRKAGEPLLHGIPGHRKPITFIEDNAIPVPRLGEFVKRLREIVTAHGTIASYWAHASVGVLHVRPLIDIHDDADREKMKSIAVAAADLARELGGVMSGEHGDGRVRSPLLERFYGPELMGAFKQVKRLFDPGNLLNPGNIVDLDGANPRPIASIAETLRVEPQAKRPLAWPAGEFKTFFDYSDQHGFDGAVEMCNGSGVCRKQQGGTMCPSYMATLDERHSTRGRGNALRLAITGQLVEGASEQASEGGRDEQASLWNDPGTIETLHLCLSCKACKTECPSNVDIARLKAEYTAQRYAREGAPLAAKVMGEIRTLNRLGAIAPAIANWVNGTGAARVVVNRFLGVDSRRTLPKFSTSLPSVWGKGARDEGAARRSELPGGAQPRVALFGDCFTMYNESEIGLATRRVLQGFGYEVLLADAGCCGRAKISLGLLPEAIEEIDATLERMRSVIDDDSVVAVLVAEPSCLSAIKDDWLGLKLRTPMEIRKKLASKAFLPEQFLDKRWEAHPKRPAFCTPSGEVILHGHCHQKALWGASSSGDMLRRVVGDRLKVLDSGCCGMAGSFGYTKDRFDLSMKIGELVLLPAVRKAPADACIVATGTSCRHQIHDGAGRAARHPMEWLSLWMEG